MECGPKTSSLATALPLRPRAAGSRPGEGEFVASTIRLARVTLRLMDELFTLDDAERRAEAVVSPDAWAYISGGAGDERTLFWNREAFSHFRLRPRVLVDVSSVTTETTVLGTPVSMPALVAPMAFQAIAHEEGEVAMARGAAAAQTVMCLSTVATSTPADVAVAAPEAPRWLQIYVFRDREVSDDVISQALEAGFSALVLTADLPVYGIRHREVRLGFEPPEENVPAIAAARALRAGPEHHALELLESGLQWDYVTELRERWKVPVVVKGLVTAEDAILACEHGASAVVVSNHGGRQLDGTIASLDALPDIVDAVGNRAEVYLDGGVRRGSDIVMALALGARAVLVGRPALYGLAFGGSKGVEQVLEILRDETENALALLGCRSPEEVTRAHVTRA
jgi:isopentenyl diphosphate isomerase/L-lactate dehydrogenase-like FMN-dependent dehydrogenase